MGDLVLILQKKEVDQTLKNNDKTDSDEERLVRSALCDHNLVGTLITIAKVEEMGGSIRKKCLEPIKILDRLDSQGVQKSKEEIRVTMEIKKLENRINKVKKVK